MTVGLSALGVFLLVGVILVVLVLAVIVIYNGLVRLRVEVKNAWAQIDVQLKRRHDLIPNLVETVKGYAAHERGTLEEVIQARSQAVAASGVPEKMQAEQQLTGALGRLMLLVEQYPDLKANQNFLALQEELTSTENKIGFARQFYNDTVMRYNTKIQTIPTNIVAGVGGFSQETFFEVQEAGEREAPQVKF
ncbi:MAG TPA: LemA family protein [bacterium]|nr:LemA family protein [bacterium]HPO10213.1 LemA family protein [bacterium]HQO37146.1 LemA family protein [bacterium]